MQRSARWSVLLLGLSAALPAIAAAPLWQPDNAPATGVAASFQATVAAPNKKKCTNPEAAFKRDAQGRIKVGEDVNFAAQNGEYAATKAGMNLAWRQELHHPGAAYIAAHFKHFNLPSGAAVVVRSPDSARMATYTGQGKTRFGGVQGFWAQHVSGDRAIVEIWSRHPVGKGAVQLDGYARGFTATEMGVDLAEPEAICGADDSKWAQCYAGTDVYTKAKAVARLLINGSGACTGWLVGSEGHLITNNHCIGTSGDASNTDFEFMAEGATCTTACNSWLGCPGTVAANSATFVQTDSALDYTLVKLPTNASTTYGYLQMRTSGAVLSERIYIPGHPAAWGKRISVESSASGDGGFCKVGSLTQSPCTGGDADVGYMCDTQGGSSGSPVLGYGDNAVVALHHCGSCNNTGVPIDDVIADLGGNVPADGTTGGGGGNTPPVANFSFTTSGLSATFTDTSTDSDGTIASRSWSFGDGTSSTATNPSHPYASSGTYNVTLNVTDNDGAPHSVTKPVTVSGSCGVPGTSCSSNSQCCSGKCKGKPGGMTCR